MTDPLTEDELSRDRFASAAAAAQRSQRFGVGIIVGLAVLVAVISTAVSVWNTTELRQLTRDTRELLRNELPIAAALEVEEVLKERERDFGAASVRCLLEQLSEHRHLTALAHRADAGVHGYSYPIPPEEEPPPVSSADTVCEPFLSGDKETNR